MQIAFRSIISIVLFSVAAFAGNAAGEGNEASANSGFLGDDGVYASLTDVKLPDGAKSRRWIGPNLTPANYNAILIDPVTLYPKPEPGPQVDSETLGEISKYLNEKLQETVAAKLTVTDQAAAGVVRMQVAVTGVAVQKEGLKPRDVIPVAAVFHLLKAASNESNMDVLVHVEARLVDSQSGELLGAAVRQLTGEDLHGDKAQLQLKDVKKSLDEAADEAAESAYSVLAPKTE